MYIRKTIKNIKNKTYENYILIETVKTSKCPRQKTICSLGPLSPGPRKEWLAIANKLQDALAGQMTFDGEDETVQGTVESIKRK